LVPKVADAIASLSEFEAEDTAPRETVNDLFAELAGRDVPGGLIRRVWALGGLQAQIFRAYLVYGVRSRFTDVEERDRRLGEANLRVALNMVDSMGYLRGAAMKLGQALANFPEILPDQIVETIERLTFQAPPMHFSLLREHVRNELGRDPEEAFAAFDTRAFAAASLGQVHGAALASGEPLAVKIQYPGIGRAIRADFRALSALLVPLRLSRGWEHIKAQVEDVRRVVEMETDYEREADNLVRGRALFSEDDAIVVPRVYRELSTRRVLTMERLGGTHIDGFLARGPSQGERNRFGGLIFRATGRLHYSARVLYADPSPGNFLFLPDGRLGVIDFGCVRPYSDEEWRIILLADRSIQEGPDLPISSIREFAGLAQGEAAPEEHLQLLASFSRWSWRPYQNSGPFDFGDGNYLREGVEILSRFYSERFSLGIAMAVFNARWWLGMVALLYRLRACFDAHAIYESERNRA
jgi:hypothetical protein